MPPVNLPTLWVAVLNIISWPIIHIALAWLFLKLPAAWFHRRNATAHHPVELFCYDTFFQIKRWKHLLPDGAAWFRGGFSKRHLASRDIAYLDQFITESRRGEAAHWAMLFACALFFLWNPPWAEAVMVAYALAANLPCIVTQRYNRFRILAIKNARLLQCRSRAPLNSPATPPPA